MTTRAELLTGVAERRHLPFVGVELREAGGSGLTFTGYASVTNSPYEIESWMGSYTETICSGAFKRTLARKADVNFLLNHDGVSMARTKSGTLKLSEDSTGLHVEANLDPANPRVAELRSGVERGDLDEMSFAFRVVEQTWNDDESTRDITEVNMERGGDVSVVNFGANPATAGSPALAARALSNALTPLHEGRTLDDSQMATLLRVLAAVAGADVQIDAAQADLAALLNVPNPDADAEDEAVDDEAARALRVRRLLTLNRAI